MHAAPVAIDVSAAELVASRPVMDIFQALRVGPDNAADRLRHVGFRCWVVNKPIRQLFGQRLVPPELAPRLADPPSAFQDGVCGDLVNGFL
ncbi:MAG TPA: hypothetical protein P5555_17305 [Candidatus Paceibacterota bacterium]|nr:hypothetical protein [Verrucomicrobiota bacterium]HRZ46937.1 hypothetical protein [Candidatus Paceibacterota bacterium]